MPVLYRQTGVPGRQAAGSSHRQLQGPTVSWRAAEQEWRGEILHVSSLTLHVSTIHML